MPPATRLWWRDQQALAAYQHAKATVWRAGFREEAMRWRSCEPHAVTETDFLREAAWVVLNSGMRESVVRARFPLISASFRWWRSAAEIARHSRECIEEALACFRHEPKIQAIASIAKIVARDGMATWRDRLASDDVMVQLQALPFIGPTTAYHLAKNLGLNVAKPDRHLTRIATAAGYVSPAELCTVLARMTMDDVAVADTILWRYATLASGYRSLFMATAEHH